MLRLGRRSWCRPCERSLTVSYHVALLTRIYLDQYVKMVHNGIEYGDMQLICEVSLPNEAPPFPGLLEPR